VVLGSGYRRAGVGAIRGEMRGAASNSAPPNCVRHVYNKQTGGLANDLRPLRAVSDKKLLVVLHYHGTLCGGLAAMQIRFLMQPGALGPEAIAAMGDTLDAALKELQEIRRSDVQSDVVRETIAGRIIGVARLGERDPARLRGRHFPG
jgi:hypothetical protein